MTLETNIDIDYGARFCGGPQGSSAPISQPRGTKCVGRSPKLLETNPKLHKKKLHKGRRIRQETTTRQKKTATKVMHWNAMGLTEERKDALQIFLHENEIDVCCIQESHLKEGKSLKIRGYQEPTRNDRQNRPKGGVVTLVRNGIKVTEVKRLTGEAEYIHMKISSKDRTLELVNYYCPEDKSLSLDTLNVPDEDFLIVGDFNSRSQSWGYDNIDKRGEEVEAWQDDHRLILINDPADTPTFYSGRWRTTTTPDLAMCTGNLHPCTKRDVCKQLGGSDHRPVVITIEGMQQENQAKHARWNYKKANWGLFAIRTNELTKDLVIDGRNPNNVAKVWTNSIIKAAKETIPRGVIPNYKPYWDEELRKLHEDVTAARDEAEKIKSTEKHNYYQKCKAAYLKKKLENTRRAWREKTSNLDMNNSSKLWKLMKSLNDEGGANNTIALEDQGKLLTSKEAANAFGKAYANESNVDIPVDRRNSARKEERELADGNQDIPELMQSCLTMNELDTAIRKLKNKKSPGPDGISNEMIQHLGNRAKDKLLEIFNLTWTKGDVPQMWREAHMIPILKKGKNKSKCLSYRPISLTSCVCKTMERIVNLRMQWHLEKESVLIPEQAGFRQYRSTDDQTAHLAQVIEDAFQEQKVALTTFIDLQKAFDKVWKDGVAVKLLRSGIRGRMYRWTKSYMHNRRARVLVDGQQGKKFLLHQGVPQGGVLSPTLFILFINDIVKDLPRGVKAALYADDLVLWCTEEEAGTAAFRMQLALDQVNKWTKQWCVTINKDKSSTTLFTLSPKKDHRPLTLDGIVLRKEDQQTYLGITYDKRLTWSQHISGAEAKARRKLHIMRKLAGTQWGCSAEVLKQVYQGTVRPHLEQGSSAWISAAKSHKDKLEKVQNQGLRIITGAMKSTPIVKMQEITGIEPLQKRWESKTLTSYTKASCLEDHPTHERTKKRGKERIRRTCFVRQAREIKKNLDGQLPESVERIQPLDFVPPWRKDATKTEVRTSVPGIEHRDIGQEVLKKLTMEMMEDKYPAQAWTQIFTDGSATDAVKTGGAGVFIKLPNGHEETISKPTGTHCSNFKAETEALLTAANEVKKLIDNDCQIVFLTDSKSALEALQSGKLPKLQEALDEINCSRIVLQWIPAHCGIAGNERADTLAKDGAKEDQTNSAVTYQEMKAIIKSLHKPHKAQKNYYKLRNRREEVIILRLRTGHNRLNSHMYRLKLVKSPKCQCGTADQTTEHVLDHCPTLNDLRQATWPKPIPLHQKLYGSLVDLRTTANFMVASGFEV